MTREAKGWVEQGIIWLLLIAFGVGGIKWMLAQDAKERAAGRVEVSRGAGCR